MLKTTLGQLLVNDKLPKDLQDYNRVLDKKGIQKLLQEVIEKHPEQYKQIAKHLFDVGHVAAYMSGGQSFGLKHLKTSKAGLEHEVEMEKIVEEISNDPKLSDKQKEEKIIVEAAKRQKPLEEAVYNESLAEGNPLADQVKSGSRGTSLNLKSLRAGDSLYVDHHNNVIPIPITRSYSKGLKPHEYWAGTFGARASVIATKFSTQDSGAYGKQLTQLAHRLIVTANDADDPKTLENRGLPIDTDDPDNEGALLARDVGPYKRNSVITPKMMSHLKELGHQKILVRSPLVSGSPEGGIYANDVGIREKGRIAPLGDNVGIAAVQALAEPMSQAQLCLTGDTVVRMADWGTKDIKDIKIGDTVLGANNEGYTFPVKVINTFDNGIKECYCTEFKIGSTKERIFLSSTLDHKVLADHHYSPFAADCHNIGQLPVGLKAKRYAALMQTGFDDTGLKKEPFALLLGLLLGDGCYTKSVHGCHLSCFDDLLPIDIEPYLTSLNLKLTLLAGQRGYYRVSQINQIATQQNKEDGRFTGSFRNPIMKYLSDNEMLYKYAHEKTIPQEAYGWDNTSVAELIGGLIVTDGSVYINAQQSKRSKPYINFGSTSETMVRQLRDLLLWRFGIRCGSIHVNNYGQRKRTMYSLTITSTKSILRFAEKIPLYGQKRVRLSQILKSWVIDRDYDHDKYYRTGAHNIGPQQTYDIEVDHPDHLFVLANGLIVGNSSKHSGGIAGAAKGVSGFHLVNQLVQVPKHFKGGAAHSQVDGKVEDITEAPAGGHFVTVNGQRHYVGVGFDVKVKKGDTVEAGDVLSDGIPNPAEVVDHKGIGGGRRYFMKAYGDAYTDAGIKAHRRNIEVLTRGLINHVRFTDEHGDNVPDDVVPYSFLEHTYAPREDHEVMTPEKAVNKYLEKPVLHYTIGTKIRPSVIKELKDFDIKNIHVHHNPPPFKPEMIRGMANLSHDPDWMTRMLGSNLQKGLLDAVHRGAVSDERGTSYVPGLARSVEFGRKGLVRDWHEADSKFKDIGKVIP